MRKAMLLALATHLEVADMKIVESWTADHGFETWCFKMTRQGRWCGEFMKLLRGRESVTRVEEGLSDEGE